MQQERQTWRIRNICCNLHQLKLLAKEGKRLIWHMAKREHVLHLKNMYVCIHTNSVSQCHHVCLCGLRQVDQMATGCTA